MLLRWALAEIQREDGGSVYFRLSTRPLDQPERTLDAGARRGDRRRRYWLREPAPGAELAIAYCGAVAAEAIAAHDGDRRGHAGRRAAGGHLARAAAPRLAGGAGAPARPVRAERLLARLRPGAALVTVTDGHPATLSWLGAVARNVVVAARRRPLRPVRRHPGPLPRCTGSIATPSSTPRRGPACGPRRLWFPRLRRAGGAKRNPPTFMAVGGLRRLRFTRPTCLEGHVPAIAGRRASRPDGPAA